MSRYAWDKFSKTISVRYVLSYLCGTLYLDPFVSLKRTFAFSVGGLFSLSTLALTWLRLHSLKLQILPITCQLDVKLKMMWWTPIKQLYSPRYHGYFSDWVDKNYFSQSSKRLGHASLITPLSWCLEKPEKIKLRFGMFQHINFQKKPLKDNRNLNVEITNNYWIRLSIKIPSVCIHSKTSQPRPQVFSANCPVFWQLCCRIDVIFYISQTSSNFGQQWLFIMNYPWDFSQS